MVSDAEIDKVSPVGDAHHNRDFLFVAQILVKMV